MFDYLLTFLLLHRKITHWDLKRSSSIKIEIHSENKCKITVSCWKMNSQGRGITLFEKKKKKEEKV